MSVSEMYFRQNCPGVALRMAPFDAIAYLRFSSVYSDSSIMRSSN